MMLQTMKRKKQHNNHLELEQHDHEHDDGHSSHHHHAHHHHSDYNLFKLSIFLFCVVVFFFAEIGVGLAANSLALIADAFHALSDIIGLSIAIFGHVYAKRPPTTKFSYGYGRATIVGGLTNGIFLLGVIVFILLDIVERLFRPKSLQHIELVVGVALCGMFLNVFGMILFWVLVTNID
jgi:cobalt-zinc-cadmium efflux system protein